MTPQYIQWTIPSVLYKTRRENPLVHKGLLQEKPCLIPILKKNVNGERSGSLVECLTEIKGFELEPHQQHCVVSLSKTH